MLIHDHDSRGADPLERALGLGQAAAPQIAAAADRYVAFMRASGLSDARIRQLADGCHAALAEWSPSLARELDHIAAGAQLDPTQLRILNARTEILAATRVLGAECSAVAVADGARSFGFQTWDWLPALAPAGMVWRYTSDMGRAVTTFTEPGMLAKIGVNDGGLGLHFNILHHHSDSRLREYGVPVHAVARAVLDGAASMLDAAELAASAATCASTVFTCVSYDRASGRADAGAIEVSPIGTRVVPAEAGVVAHTNHFLDPWLAAGEATDEQDSWERQEHLIAQRSRVVEGREPTATLPDVARLLGFTSTGQPAPVCVHADPAQPVAEQWETLLSVRTDPVRGELEWFPGSPDRAAQGPSERPPR